MSWLPVLNFRRKLVFGKVLSHLSCHMTMPFILSLKGTRYGINLRCGRYGAVKSLNSGKWIFWFDPSFIKLAEYILLKTRLTIGFSAMFRTRKLRLMSRTRILISDRGVSCLMWDVSSATGVQFPTSATELNSRRYHRLISNTLFRSSPSLDWYPHKHLLYLKENE